MPQNHIDLASPPPNLIVGCTLFTYFGFDLSVANILSLHDALPISRASSGTSTSLTVPFPTTQGLFTTLPGLSVGDATVQIYNQTGSSTWSLRWEEHMTIVQ